MSHRIFLHYQPSDSFWHRHDPRIKLVELCFWSVLALSGKLSILLSILLTLVILLFVTSTKFRYLRRPLIFWSAASILIILMTGLGDSGHALSIAGYRTALGTQGLVDGGLRSLRLLTVLLAGQFFAATTDPTSLASALRRLTAFLPSSWSASISTAISLTLAFIPFIFDEAATIRDAALSRGLRHRRSIFHNAAVLGLSMAAGTLKRANLTSEALISRAMSADATQADMQIRLSDLVTLVLLAAIPFSVRFICINLY